MPIPERVALAIIRAAAPRAEREWIVGDVLEDYERVRLHDGAVAARRHLLAEAARTCAHRARTTMRGLRDLAPTREGGMLTILNDVQYALRLLRRSPGFAATAILTLALAIGANTATFSAVKGVLIAPLPYPDPDRLVRLFEESSKLPHFPMAPADFRDYRAELQTFDAIAAYMRADLQIGDASQPEQLRGMQVSSGFFHVLGYQPLFGRDFAADDEIAGNDNVAILSHALWKRRFNGDPSVVGRTASFSGRTFRIVGVLPESVRHVGGSYRSYGHGEPVDVWWALPVPREEIPRHRFSHYYNVIGRMKPGVTWAALEEDLRRTRVGVASRYPTANSPWTPRAVPLKDEIVGTAQSTIVALAGAAAAVLLLACVNVAGLLLGRATGRSREIGVRAALGATRPRLARQLLIESLVLATAGGAIGIALAYAATAALARFGPSDIPRLQMIAVDREVLGYALGATVTCALLFGLAPALRLARTRVGDTLKEGSRSIAGSSHHSHQWMRRVLAAVQVALAFVLVVSSGLLLRSFVSLIDTNPGFIPAGAITASIELPMARYTLPGAADFYARAADRIRALPGVEDAAFTSDLPWTAYDENTGFSIVGRQSTDDGPGARYHFIGPGYARATGTPLLAGRMLSTSDTATAPLVVMINASTARRYWTTPEAAVGARISMWGDERTVAGILGDVRDMPWHDRAAGAIYLPIAQTWFPQPMLLVVRTAVNPTSIVEPMRQAIRDLDPQLPLSSVKPLEAVAGAAMATRRLTLWVVGLFGVTAFVLAVVGIYGVMAQAVSQRAREFGIRQALGATRGDILGLVFSNAATMTIGGLLAGVALALASTQLLASLLYGVTAFDASTFTAVGVLLSAAAALASYLPARRATRVSAASALRSAE